MNPIFFHDPALAEAARALEEAGISDGDATAALLELQPETILTRLARAKGKGLSPKMTAHYLTNVPELDGEGEPGADARPQGSGEPWPAFGPLPGGLRAVPAFPPALVPKPLRPWIADITERFQCPVEFPAVGAVVVLGAAVGRSIGIRPKRLDDWTVVPNIWGGLVGRPGIMKSPALAEALKPLYRLDAKARKEHEQAAKMFEMERSIAKAAREAKIKQATMNETAKAALIQSVLSEPAPPAQRRYVLNDPTVEKLGEILNQNPRGVLLFRDELTGWLRTLDREGREGDRAFYLEAWNGTGAFTYDRIGRGTIHIAAACVSVLGGIQPGPLGDYLRLAAKGGAGDDGLVQRFQLLVYPDTAGEWRNVDRRPDIGARDRAWAIIENLAKIDPAIAGADPGEIPFLRFDEDGQRLFDEWREALEKKIRSGDEAPIMESQLAKYRSLMPSLALLFRLAEAAAGGSPGPVTVAEAELAAAWCELLETHARRIYQGVTERHHVPARLLGQKIKSGKIGSPFTVREIYRGGWSGLDTPEGVEGAAAILEEAGWVRREVVPGGSQGGRPSARFWINPEVLSVLAVPPVGVQGSREEAA